MIDLGPKTSPVFVQPLGCDFPKAVANGLIQRSSDAPLADLARVTLIVNTSRMARRIKAILQDGPAGFLPKILLLEQLDTLLSRPPPPRARATLRRRLELAQLIAPVIEQHPELAAKASLFAIVDSLASLMDEMHGEGVSIDAIKELDVSDQSGHWQNAQTLIGIAHDYVCANDVDQDREARQRDVVQMLSDQWKKTPPTDPIILAGSTGSRGTTALLMHAIAKLPNGAVILPGFDTDLPTSVWGKLDNPMTSEDHPQYRFAKLMQDLDLHSDQMETWHSAHSGSVDRNAVVSLSLRPAPVTDSWLTEGPKLPDLPSAMQDVTLLEAPTQRAEALAIAMRLRAAAEFGQTAALITPDRMLSRQVSAALDRWNIVPDDSGGTPLHLTAPGRFLRHTAELFFRPLDAEQMLTLLKHPLTQSRKGAENHGLYAQRFELALRRHGVAYPDPARLRHLAKLAAKDTADPTAMESWTEWLCLAFKDRRELEKQSLESWLEKHRALSEFIAGGLIDDAGGLWDKTPGRSAADMFATLEENAQHGGLLDAREYSELLHGLLSQQEVRDRDQPHPNIMIWGTLEARVQGADLVILGGLNEGVWPEAVAADTWLNRSLRNQAGLLLPDRKIGLSGHDYQQGMAAPEVWIARSIRSDDSETVPSRWVNRLLNLMSGLHERHGPEAIQQMRARGQIWLSKSEQLEKVIPVMPEGRAAPRPPISARPRDFSVTEIKTLIRDPYAIYARHCLKLRPLDPLQPEPDAALRGIVVHDIMEKFVRRAADDPSLLTADTLMRIVDDVLADSIPWPTARVMWRARIWRIADWIVAGEQKRRALGVTAAMENTAQGKLALPSIAGSIRARADRIDVDEDGRALLYDYKSGEPPSAAQQRQFDKQLLIEAAMIEEGAFDQLGPRAVRDAVYIGLGNKPKEVVAPLDKETPGETLAGLRELITSYLDPNQYFLSRRMLQSEGFSGNYDHLARHGEWDDSDPPSPKDVS